MGRKPTNYQNTIIYVIKCRDDNITEEYIGSTTNFNERKCHHKINCNNEKSIKYNLKIYKFIRDNGGWDNWIMLEVLKYPCNDKNEARMKEEEIRVDRKAKLNSHKAFGAETREEYLKQWYEENKDKILEQKKQYREENKEAIKEQAKIYNDEHKEKHKQYREEHKEEIKEYMKQYREKHKEDKREYDRLYRIQNQEKIKEHKRQQYQLKKQQQMEEIK